MVVTGQTGSASPAATAGATGSIRTTTSPSPTVRVVVDVAGKVRRPGLVRLPAGSRVDDAIRAAGGALPGTDLTAVNLARVVVDGEQIMVGPGPPAAAGSAPTTATGSGTTLSAAPINLNTATETQFETLPGVGPVLAQRIVDWRTEHGRFDSVDQLRQVSGIGDAKFSELRSLVTV